MARIPTDLSGQQVRRALQHAGFVFRRQRGSHMVLGRDETPARVVVPDHRQIRKGTLSQILHDAGLSVEQLLDLL